MEIGLILKKLRTEKNLTQLELANLLNLERRRYSNYETGKRKPDFDNILQLSKFFNVSIEYLTGISNDPNPNNEDDKIYNKTYNVLKENGFIEWIKQNPDEEDKFINFLNDYIINARNLYEKFLK